MCVCFRCNEVTELGIVTNKSETRRAVRIDNLRMKFAKFRYLFFTCLPQSLTGAFEHDGSHLFQSGRILLFEILFDSQVQFILHIYIIYIIPKLFVDCSRFHHIPSIGIGDHFCKFTCRRSPAFHFLFDVSWVQDSGATFYADSLFQFLHLHMVPVAIITEVGIRIFAGHIAYGEIHTSHKFVYMVKA